MMHAREKYTRESLFVEANALILIYAHTFLEPCHTGHRYKTQVTGHKCRISYRSPCCGKSTTLKVPPGPNHILK